ncbi:MAG: hypothetical protein VKO00_10010 [Cyanobacteriota bacterium]|nr:hypothetical protein [Cyanobacteriota bacterium]
MSGSAPSIDLDGLVQRVARSTGLPPGRVRRVIAATFAELAAALPVTDPASAAASANEPPEPEPVDPYRWLPLRRPKVRWP